MYQSTNLPTTNVPIYQPSGLLFCGPLPSGHPAWVLPSTVPYGARTFLPLWGQSGDRFPQAATAWPTWRQLYDNILSAAVKEYRKSVIPPLSDWR